MRFIIERLALVKMVERLKGERLRDERGRMKRDEGELQLTACGAMVFVEANGVTGGCEAMVMDEGTCRLPRVRFLEVLKSFAPKQNLHCGANDERLRVERFEIRMRGYSPHTVAPEGFTPFPATPNWLEIPGALGERLERTRHGFKVSHPTLGPRSANVPSAAPDEATLPPERHPYFPPNGSRTRPILQKSEPSGDSINAMKSPSNKPGQPSSNSRLAETLEQQLQMVREWETRPGQFPWGTAEIFLEQLKKPMTQESFLRMEGLGGLDLDELLEELEMNVADGTVPPWFDRLPRG